MIFDSLSKNASSAAAVSGAKTQVSRRATKRVPFLFGYVFFTRGARPTGRHKMTFTFKNKFVGKHKVRSALNACFIKGGLQGERSESRKNHSPAGETRARYYRCIDGVRVI